jgi:hypothetical protein
MRLETRRSSTLSNFVCERRIGFQMSETWRAPLTTWSEVRRIGNGTCAGVAERGKAHP